MAETHSTLQSETRPRAALTVKGLERVFGGVSNPTYALRGITLSVEDGQFAAVMGPSGSGKTTLLNCIATIDKPTSGSVKVGGIEVSRLRGRALAKFRRDDLGFIFQDSNLIDTLTGYESIALTLSIQGEGPQAFPSASMMWPPVWASLTCWTNSSHRCLVASVSGLPRRAPSSGAPN